VKPFYLSNRSTFQTQRAPLLPGGKSYDTCHIRPDDVPFEEQLEAFNDLITQGKVRHMGVSNETSWG
jgi:aryl-alcohol dehydrogenase-like predicted oxidoreductase